MDGVGDGAASPEDGNTRAHARGFIPLVLLGVIVLTGFGWGVVRVVAGLDTDADCGSYGYGGYRPYGGYGCEPNHEDARLEVEPSTALVDRQTVTVRGIAFDPNTTFGAAECGAEASQAGLGVAACDLSAEALGRTGDDGSITLPLRVRRVIVVQGKEIDCAVANACIIGAATIPDGFTPTEAASAPIQFDPSIPAFPRLQVQLTVTEVSKYAVRGTAVCNREADFFVDASLHQVHGSRELTAEAYGDFKCRPTPITWVAPFVSGVLGSGTVEYSVSGFAFDGFENASAEATGTAHVSGGPRYPRHPITSPGDTVAVTVKGSHRQDAQPVVDLQVTCGHMAHEAYASLNVSQFVGHAVVHGYGSVEFGPCNGATTVSVPLQSFDGVLATGPALVQANVFVFDESVPGDAFSDSASVIDTVRLRGRTEPQLAVPPNPTSRIVITGATKSSIMGTVSCDEPVTVSLYAQVQQLDHRTISSTLGEIELADCSGSKPFTITLQDNLKKGDAYVAVYGDAYREGDGIPESVWNDYQAAELHIRK
jgi:hypothetical protein